MMTDWNSYKLDEACINDVKDLKIRACVEGDEVMNDN